ncbi:hypothetical protein [Cupriavidus sp. Marseille-Q8015]
MKRIREALRALLQRWLAPVTITVDPNVTVELCDKLRDAMQRGQRGQLLAPVQYVTMSDPGPLFWGKLAVDSTHYFNAFDGIAGAAFNERNPDGVLRPFGFDAGPEHMRVLFCVIVLVDGFKAVGVNYGPADGTPYSLATARRLSHQAAMAQVLEHMEATRVRQRAAARRGSL